jgi:hypothetical protein
MAILPFRGLAEKGILHDPSPYQLDLDAWSDGAGIRFHGNKAMRAPIFRSVVETLSSAPSFCTSHTPVTGYDSVFIGDEDGTTWAYSNGTLTNITPTGQVLNISATVVGSGYVEVPTVTLGAPPMGGTQATATAVLTGGGIPGFIITNPGAGYTSNPSVTITAAPGGGTSCVAVSSIFSAATDPRKQTSTFLGSVTYLNRPTAPPVYFGTNSTYLQGLPGWDGSWTCRSLRSFSDYLIALNVTKGTNVNPSLVKWSDLTLNGQAPGSWNSNDPTTSAGENPLEALTTPIVDGLSMRGLFVIYSEDQIWSMAASGDNNIFDFARLFGDGGMIAPGCGVEVDGQHYVFGPTDIYRHDGSSKQSLIDKRNRDYVYRNLNQKYVESCFVLYMPKYNEIMFGYNSGDSTAVYRGGTRCNKAAVYNIPGDTWAFLDLPNVGAACLATLNDTLTYATATAQTYFNVGGSYFDQDNTYEQNVVLVSEALTGLLTTNRLLAYDFYDKGSLAFPFSTEANAPAYLERTGIDLDQVGSDLMTYKLIRRMFPLVSIFDNVPIQIQIGGALTPAGSPNWGPTITFNPVTQYKIDVIKGGRYLGVRFLINAPVDFEINGFDLDVGSAGKR